jgi:predicted transcriptional regulator
MVTLNTYLQQKMKEKSINITGLSKKSGIPRTTVHNIVKYSLYSPQFRSVIPILKALDITIDDLYKDNVRY